MNLLDLVTTDTELKRKTATEYAGPCPSCGGTDRFIIQPEKGPTGRYWCRQCGIKGDAIQYLRDFKNMGYREACKFLSIEPRVNNSSSPARVTTAAQWKPRVLEQPKDTWQVKAASFAGQAVENLNSEIQKGSPVHWKAEAAKVRQWLMQDRGLSESTIHQSGLGWSPRDYFPPRKSWGLPDKEGRDKEGQKKTTTKMFLPEGVVIPYRQDGQISRIRIRRSNPGVGSRYILLSGSETGPMILKGETAKVVIIVESELDALLLREKAGDIVLVIAMGSAQARPDLTTDLLLRQAETVLISLDSDQAGANEAWRWWKQHYPNSKRWPPVNGKDPGEMFKAGIDISIWVQAALLKTTVRASERHVAARKVNNEGQSMGQFGNALQGAENPGISNHQIHSKTFGRKMEFTVNSSLPGQVFVDGIPYSTQEAETLRSKNLQPGDLGLIHALKGTFEGSVLSDDETSILANHSISKW